MNKLYYDIDPDHLDWIIVKKKSWWIWEIEPLEFSKYKEFYYPDEKDKLIFKYV